MAIHNGLNLGKPDFIKRFPPDAFCSLLRDSCLVISKMSPLLLSYHGNVNNHSSEVIMLSRLLQVTSRAAIYSDWSRTALGNEIA